MSTQTLVSGGFGSMFRSATASLSTWLRRRQIEQELTHLDDRLLADIGVNRGEIPALARASSTAVQPANAAKSYGYHRQQAA